MSSSNYCSSIEYCSSSLAGRSTLGTAPHTSRHPSRLPPPWRHGSGFRRQASQDLERSSQPQDRPGTSTIQHFCHSWWSHKYLVCQFFDAWFLVLNNLGKLCINADKYLFKAHSDYTPGAADFVVDATVLWKNGKLLSLHWHSPMGETQKTASSRENILVTDKYLK